MKKVAVLLVFSLLLNSTPVFASDGAAGAGNLLQTASSTIGNLATTIGTAASIANFVANPTGSATSLLATAVGASVCGPAAPLCQLGIQTGLQLIGSLLSGFSQKKQAPMKGFEFRGPQALEALRKQGANIPSNVDPNSVRAVAIQGRGYFTPEELERYGWVRNENGEWVAGPNATPLPILGDAKRIELQWSWSAPEARGPNVFIVGRRSDVTFVATATLVEIVDGVAKEPQSDTTVLTYSFVPKEIGCGFVEIITLTATVNGYSDSIEFPYYYNVEGFGSSQGGYNNSTQCSSKSNYVGEFKRVTTGSGRDSGTASSYPGGGILQSQATNNVTLGSLDDEGEKTPDEMLDEFLNSIGRPSGFGGGGGFGGFSGGVPSPQGVKDALNRLENFAKNTVQNEDDLKAIQDYLRGERQILQNATPEERWVLVSRMKSVDDLIRSGSYQPGKLGQAITEKLQTGVYLPGDWVSFIFSPEMSGNSETQLELRFGDFLSSIPR